MYVSVPLRLDSMPSAVGLHLKEFVDGGGGLASMTVNQRRIHFSDMKFTRQFLAAFQVSFILENKGFKRSQSRSYP